MEVEENQQMCSSILIKVVIAVNLDKVSGVIKSHKVRVGVVIVGSMHQWSASLEV